MIEMNTENFAFQLFIGLQLFARDKSLLFATNKSTDKFSCLHYFIFTFFRNFEQAYFTEQRNPSSQHLPDQSDQWICSELITVNIKAIIVTPLTSLLMILLARRANICRLDSCYLDERN